MTLLSTPLSTLHTDLGAKMVPFAGYSMPVQYPMGIIKEHLHTRAHAGLFDVSHMGQVIIQGAGVAQALESLVPADLEGLKPNCQTYTLLTNAEGGVIDDLIVTRIDTDSFFLVVNAGCKARDIEYLKEHLKGMSLTVKTDQALLALQGPEAREVMQALCPVAADLKFMHSAPGELQGEAVYVSCCGYTGEDGFEISLPGNIAHEVASEILSYDAVEAVGLGARDSLRLESGLCLYGHELSEAISPVEAGLAWSISKVRRPDGARPGGFPGAEVIFEQLSKGPSRRRVGLVVEGKRPVREDQAVVNSKGEQIGTVCSAGYGASVGGPIAMAYVETEYSKADTSLAVDVRGKSVPVRVSAMPFIPQRYFRG